MHKYMNVFSLCHYYCFLFLAHIISRDQRTPFIRLYKLAGIACWLERRTRNRKVASSNPGRSGGRIFFSGVTFVCWLLFAVRSTPVLLQWHATDPGHTAKSAGGRLHLNTHTPLTQRSRSGLNMPLATRQETLGYSRFSSLSHCGLILAWEQKVDSACASWSPLSKKKSAGGKWIVEPSQNILASEEKATTNINNITLTP